MMYIKSSSTTIEITPDATTYYVASTNTNKSVFILEKLVTPISITTETSNSTCADETSSSSSMAAILTPAFMGLSVVLLTIVIIVSFKYCRIKNRDMPDDEANANQFMN